MYRISSNMRYSQNLARLQRTTQKVVTSENRLADGKRYRRPSEDPGAYRQIADLKHTLEIHRGYRANLQQSRSLLEGSDQSLQALSEHLSAMKALVVNSTNVVMTLEDRHNLAHEVDQTLASVAQLSNSKVQQTYVFGGVTGDTAPFEWSRNPDDEITAVDYRGSDSAYTVPVDKSHRMSVTVSGEFLVPLAESLIALRDTLRNQAYTPADFLDNTGASTFVAHPRGTGTSYANLQLQITPPAAGGDFSMLVEQDGAVVETWDGLTKANVATVLNDPTAGSAYITVADNAANPNIPAIPQSVALPEETEAQQQRTLGDFLAPLGDIQDTLLARLSAVGSRADSLEQLDTRHEATEVRLQDMLANLEDVDIAEAATNLWREENAYRSTLYVISQIPSHSLLQYLT